MSVDSRYLSHCARFLDDDDGVLLVTAPTDGLFFGREAYHQEFSIPYPENERDEWRVRRLLGAASLAALTLHDRESWGWTMTLPGVPRGFFCAAEPDGRLCAVTREADAQRAIAVLQRQKAGGALVQSNLEAPTDDPLDAVQSYYDQVVQTETRLAFHEDGRAALAQALPQGSLARYGGLRGEELVDAIHARAAEAGETAAEGDAPVRQIGEVLLFYACRCNDEMILEMITSLPDDQRKQLWGDEATLHVECPRCGRGYTIRRAST